MIAPGATLGVLGSGQLGRMFAVEARRLGYGVHVLSPRPGGTPAGQVADREVTASYDDLEAVTAFARTVDVVTYEFEQVSPAAAEACAELVPVRPSPRVLAVARDRVREKSTLRDAGLPVTPFAAVRRERELARAAGEVGAPGVLKTARGGYDGKGQVPVETADGLDAAWTELGADEAVYERFVDFERELSVVAARGVDGRTALYGPMHNRHVDHVLDVSLHPADVPPEVEEEAREIGRAVMEALEVVGVLCVELFLTAGGGLLINEIAPRPHNSGHLTIEGHVTSQFEQHVRAVCGLPPGSADPVRPAAMANLLGDLWSGGAPDWASLLAHDDVKLHLYGKREARPGRKMGHVTALADEADAAAEKVEAARAAL